jgi:glycosyltransferase involved in cell wall biosynthesis
MLRTVADRDVLSADLPRRQSQYAPDTQSQWGRVSLLGERRHVAILLSTYNGENFLAAQLHSFLAQTHHDWTVHWRDDGSTDATVQVVGEFAAGPGEGRCVFQPAPGRQQLTRSFLNLLGAARVSSAMYFAFSDQDDVWLPEKLSRGIAALDAAPAGEPALYCARRILVDSELRRTGEPGLLRRRPGFPQALTHNIAPGCTMMLNRAAADLVLRSPVPETTWHDWWCYLLVAAADGQVLTDREATVLYRQHAGNWIGESKSFWRRGFAALRRGPGPFMRVMRHHVAALQENSDLLTEEARQYLSVIARGLDGDITARIKALRLPGMVRQTWPETLIFRLWFMLG